MKTDKIPVPGTVFENNLKERLMNSSSEDLERQRMVREQLECRGIRSRMVLDALAKVPRHLFIPADIRHLAYTDHALLTYCGQTISQPFIVAKMTEMLSLEPNHRVLEIGTGTGYQTAILAELAGEVYTMERIKELHDLARENLSPFHYSNIHYLYGNGYNGYPDAAPYHAIIVTAAPPSIPQSLIDQLAPGGQMVIPVGTDFQILYLVTKDADGLIHEIPVFSVVFVPMVK